MAAAGAVSFRDPGGRLFLTENRVLRLVSTSAWADLSAFRHSRVAQELEAEGRLVETRSVSASEVEVLARRAGPHGIPSLATEGVRMVEHDPIAFPSYPYEWPPEMFAAAAELTLDLHKRLLGEGLGLKDATPYNVLFRGPTPVFVDVLSVERREPRDGIWWAQAQFVRTFLLPLLVEKHLGIPLAQTMAFSREGLDPEEVHRMLGRPQRLKLASLSLVTIPTWLGRSRAAVGERLYRPRMFAQPEKAEFVLRSMVRGLKRHLRRVSPAPARHSRWSTYMEERDHYTPADAQTKDRFVKDALSQVSAQWVLDAGCNTGHYSVMAAQSGARVVAIDADPVVVGQLWRRSGQEGLDILPLVEDLARPAPAQGWRNSEHLSFLERARGRFDLVLMLALMHHLHVTERIPVDEIVALARDLSRGHVLFEYIGPKDPMFRRLARGRLAVDDALDVEYFEGIARTGFEILRVEPLVDADRVLYLLRRR
ncbi:MAG TPA: class I SAM-dependent methyltransferase [Candidatus Thermoplasmatota archaeon]